MYWPSACGGSWLYHTRKTSVTYAYVTMSPGDTLAWSGITLTWIPGTGLPVPTVSKVMKKLAQSGLVDSQRGAKGGYALTRAADDIPVTEIIAAVDGPIALTECMTADGDVCEIEALCPTRTNWRKINDAVVSALQDVTLADMAPQMAPFVAAQPRPQPLEMD